MKNKISLYGGIGTALTAVCCFTPILVIGLTGLGTVSIISYLDFVLLPLLAFFVALTAYGIFLSQKEKQICEKPELSKTELG